MPAGNQGSRLALVTWTVASSIFGVICAILAIYFYVDSTKSTDQVTRLTKQFGDVITTQGLGTMSDDIQKLKDARNDTTRGLDQSMTAFQVALAERNNLAKMISGKEDDAAAIAAVKASVDKAKAAGAKPAGDSMVDLVNSLVSELDARKAEMAGLQKDSSDAKQKLKDVIDSTNAQLASMQKTMDQLTAEKDAALQQVQVVSKTQTASFDSTAADLRKQLEGANDQINQLNNQNADLGKTIKDQQTKITTLEDKLGQKRVDPRLAVVRRVDGHISDLVPSVDQCLIDLGSNDHVTPGLTFEVYDKVKGIPAPGDPSNDDNLPFGKGSIQVKAVYPNFSVCQIISSTPGTTITHGDLVVNLVYDRRIKYKFVVYGNFDLGQTGVATPQDAEVVKQLVKLWGGEVENNINVATDFVVLGKEPVVPDKPDPSDPLAIEAYNKAVAASDEYANILAKAREYWLPVLNQNRFLIFTGYYDQAKK